MGRIFEVRKHTMFARWDRMAKQFTRIGKEIAIAVKGGGPDPATNPALRRCFQNAKSVNMPKDRVEAAIKRAMGKDMTNYEEILYEGYAPHGVALLVETATDNHVRTVANVKSHFNKGGGTLGNSGSVSFQFTKLGVFKLKLEGLNQDDLELELIDFGLEELGEGTGENGEPVLGGTRRVHRLWQYAESTGRKRHHPYHRRDRMDPHHRRRTIGRPGQ